MPHIMKYLLPIAISSVVFAAPVLGALAPEHGFSGSVTVLTGVTSNTSNFNVEQDRIQSESDLASSGSGEVDAIAGLLGAVQYTFGDSLNKQFFMGTSRDDIVTGSLAFEIGYRQQLANGTIIDVAVLPTLISGDVWDDPYAINEERKETDLTGNVLRLQVSNVAGSNFDIDMAAGQSDVDNELSGTKGTNLTEQDQERLKRERQYFYFKTGYRYFLESHKALLIPSLNVFTSDSEGKALSFFSFGGEVSYARQINKHGFMLTASVAKRDYDAENPIFNQTRKDKEYGVFLAYEYAGIMGYENWSFVSLVGANTTQSNINYYTAEQYVVSLGLDYKF